jgi:oligopeptide transport system substrate-binding protein
MARKRQAAACAAVMVVALLMAASGSPRAVKEGGTLKVAVRAGRVDTIDPALVNFVVEADLLAPACASLMAYPDKPLPAGARVAPSLAESKPVVSRNGKTYTFTIRKDARFSTGPPVTAQAFVRAIERLLDPAMDTGASDLAALIVGGDDVLAGKAKTPSGLTARGRTLTVRLTRKPPSPLDIGGICAVSPNLPADPEGAKAPLASPAPYYVAEYVPGERVALERNRFYTGERPHHVARFVADLAVDPGLVVDKVASGAYDTVAGVIGGDEIAGFAERYGVNKSQFFVQSGGGVRMFHLNMSRPLFRNNVKLRQAVNFAVDRTALARQPGLVSETPFDHYLGPGVPGYRNAHVYPLKGPDLRTARKLAKGHTRSGKAILYTPDTPVDVAQAQIIKQNLKAIGLEVEINQFQVSLFFDKIFTPGEPFDIARVTWGVDGPPDPGLLDCLFNGRLIGQPTSCNLSYFNSPKHNQLLARASRLGGAAGETAYGALDVELTRDAAPAIAVSSVNALAFVSSRVGCVVMKPDLDLTALCLK